MGPLARAVFFLSVLAGCAAPAPIMQSPGELRATHGFARVTLPAVSLGLELVPAAGGQTYLLQRQPEHGDRAYGLWIPAGNYAVKGLTNPDDTPYEPVRVERGRITDLGGLIRLQIGGYESVLLPVRHAEIAAETAQATEVLRPHLATSEPIQWQPAAPPKPDYHAAGPTNLGLIADLINEAVREANKPPLNVQLKAAKTNDEFFRRSVAVVPPLTDEPASDTDGNLYYGAELGQIRVRAPNGEWSNLDTGTLQTITAVELDGRRIVAGTLKGELRVSDDGRTWRRASAFSAQESVVDIDRVGNRWIIMTARLETLGNDPQGGSVQRTDLIKVYSTTQADLGGMTLLRELALPDKRFVIRGIGLRGQHGDGLYYVPFADEVLKLDLATLQWSSSKPGHRVDAVHVSPKGVLTVYRQQGGFSKLHMSTDKGATWRPADTPPYVFYDVYFQTPQEGLATRWATGFVSATIEFMSYDAAANVWKKTHDAPSGCVRLLRDGDNLQRFCVTSGNSVLNYVDGKWRVEMAVN